MKNKSEIRSRLISSIKVILAVGAMIAICTFISNVIDKDAYAGEQITTTKTASPIDNWEIEILGTPVITYSDGKTPYSGTIEGFSGKFTYGESNKDFSDQLKGTFSPSVNQVEGQPFVLNINKFKLRDGLTGDYQNSQNGIINGSKVTFSLQDVTIVTNFPTKPSEYDKIEEGDYEEGDDHKDVGIKVASISKSKVKSILDYVYKNDKDLKSRIDNIMRKQMPLSIAISVKELSKSTVEDKGEYKDLEKKARSYDDADDAKLEEFFDISIYVTEDDSFTESDKITDSGESLKFTYTIPDDYKKGSSTSSSDKVKKITNRYYNVFTYHDGAHSTGNDYKKDISSISFEVKDFSTFAFAYYDKTSSSTSSTSTTSSSARNTSTSTPRTPTTGGTSSGNAAGGSRTGSGAPKTGDEFNAKLWIYFLVVGVVVALCAFILYQDTKDWRDEKKEAK